MSEPRALASTGPVPRPGTFSPGSGAPLLSSPLGVPSQRRRAHSSRLRCSLSASIAEGMAAELVGAFAGGAALTGWALYLGAGPLVISVLGALPYLAQTLHLPAAWVTAGFGARRVALRAVAASRQVYLALVPLPFVPLPAEAKLGVLLGVAGLGALLAVLGNNAWIAWMAELVPGSIRGRYFGRRTSLCTLAGALAALLAGVLLDEGKASGAAGLALSGLALGAALAGAASSWLMSRQHDPGGPPAPAPRLESALEPLHHPLARRLLAYQLAWNAAVGVASSLFAVHMLQNLRMGFALVALQGAGVAAVRMLIVPLWGRAIDRLGARPVLVACSFAICGIPFLWLLPTPERLWPVALDALLSGALWSGHGLASFALPLSLAPREGRPHYLAAFSAGGGLAFAGAAAIGGAIAQEMPARIELLGEPLFGLQAIFLLSALLRLGASMLVLRLVEPGAQPVSALLSLVGQRAGQLCGRFARLSLPALRR